MHSPSASSSLSQVICGAVDLQRRFDGKRVLLGVDRLDYIKGIPHKLVGVILLPLPMYPVSITEVVYGSWLHPIPQVAMEKFLTLHPQWSGKICLVQIAVPSRSGQGALPSHISILSSPTSHLPSPISSISHLPPYTSHLSSPIFHLLSFLFSLLQC